MSSQENLEKKLTVLLNKRNKFTILIALAGILLFIFLTATFTFKNTLFSLLFPKPLSKAADSAPVELTCSFTGPTTLQANQVGTFSSTSTGNITSYVWSAPWSPAGENPTSGIASTFAWSGPTPGIYTISLTVTDAEKSRGCQADVTVK